MQGHVSSQFSIDVAVPVAGADMPGTDLTKNRTVVADDAHGIAGVLPDRPTPAKLRTDLTGHAFLSDCDLLFR
jgi:hypothetical protein